MEFYGQRRMVLAAMFDEKDFKKKIYTQLSLSNRLKWRDCLVSANVLECDDLFLVLQLWNVILKWYKNVQFVNNNNKPSRIKVVWI